MLIPDVLAEVLRFFDRRYLTELQLHGRGLRDLVDKACLKYPLARLERITIRVLPTRSAVVEIVNADYKRIDIDTVDFFDAVRDVNVVLQKSYVHRFEFCAHARKIQRFEVRAQVTRDQWGALASVIQSASVEIVKLEELDLTDVEAGQLEQILVASCLEEVVLKWSRLRMASITDAFLTLGRDSGVTRLMVHDNDIVDGPTMSVSEEAIFDYCFRAEGRHGTTAISVKLSTVHISNSFLRRLIKTMENSQSGRPYFCDIVGLIAQHDLDEFRRYERRRSNTYVAFRIPFCHNSRESFHEVHYTRTSV